jgi:hypothetical protein
LIAETPSTNNNGKILVYGDKGEIEGINVMMTINKKYMLVTRRNCSNKFFGMNVKGVYLVVVMLLVG